MVFQWLSNLIYGKEFRKVSFGNNRCNLDFVNEYAPLNSDVQQLRIMVCGVAGAGKSSFINSVFTVLKGRLAGPAPADSSKADGSFTINYRTYKIQKFLFCDTMGFENINGVSLKELKLAMKGQIEEGYEFNTATPLSEEHEFYNKAQTLNTRFHVLVFVVAADTETLLTDQLQKKMRNVRLAARDLGIPQLAILTKIDEAYPKLKDDLKSVYRNKKLERTIETLSQNLGVPVNCIFPVKNYSSEIDINQDLDTLILSAFRNIINYGEDFANSF